MSQIITPAEMTEMQSSDLQLEKMSLGFFQLQTKADKRVVSLDGKSPERMLSSLHIRKVFRTLREAGVKVSSSSVPLLVTIRRQVAPLSRS